MVKCPLLTETALVILILLLASHSTAQTIQQPQKKIALVIGNGMYTSGMPLANPENDARAMKEVLQSVGFTVMEYENLDQSQMKKAIDDFGSELGSYDVGLFFYAGHGIQSKGYNYLIPVDAQIKSEPQVEYDCVQADRVLALMEASGSKINIIILDACRNNPFERSWTRSANGRGLAFMSAPSGTLIAYATSPGSTASDGSGNNGLYTSAILESIKIPNITILEMFQNVRSIVSKKSDKQQIPWESTSLTGNFYFSPLTNTTSEPNREAGVKNSNYPAVVERGFIIDSRDDEQYKTVRIGSQVWMAENLKTTRYSNGDLIETTNPATMDISGESTPKYQWAYGGNESNVPTYGRLYTWHAINDSRNVCPTGWHVPSDEDWTTLTSYIGGVSVAGGKLKEEGTEHWKLPNNGATDEFGFAGLPGGYRSAKGKFDYLGDAGYWWSTFESTIYIGGYRTLHYNYSSILPENFSKRAGFSVRCLKD